jgi:ketosteroid isomerase-like protein
MIPADLEEFIDEYQETVRAFINGDPEPQKPLWSRAEDVTLANPLGAVALGWDAINRVLNHAAALLHDGIPSPVESITRYATADLAFTVENEHCTVRIGDAAEPADSSLRVTTIFRREEAG